MLRLGMLGVLALLSGCAMGGSDRVPCPPLVEYPPAVQRQAQAELTSLPAGSVVARMMDDAAIMRAWVRGACG